MSELTKQSCEACSADAPTVTADQKQALGKDVPDWQEIELDGEEQLQRVFKLKNFAQAQAFTNKVGDLAEEEGHHPRHPSGIWQGHRTLVDPQDRRPAQKRLHHGGAHRRSLQRHAIIHQTHRKQDV